MRRRTTRFSVRLQERVSTLLITAGGVGTIGAVTLIFVFLVAVALPLFLGAELDEAGGVDVAGKLEDRAPLHLAVDEYGILASALYPDGTVRVLDLERGELLAVLHPFEAEEGRGNGPGVPTAWSISPLGESLAFGFADGSIRLASFGYRTTFPRSEELPAELLGLEPDSTVQYEGGVLQRTPEGVFRLQRFALELGEPLLPDDARPILRLAHIADDTDAVFCAWMEGGRLTYIETEEEMDLLSGETRYGLEVHELTYSAEASRGVPDFLYLVGIGSNALVIWKDGRMERLDIRNPDATKLAEVVDLTPEEGATLTATGFLIGHSTLITGASNGAIRAWFGTKPTNADTTDGTVFVMAHELVASGPAVTTLAPSPRSRMLASGFADGTIRVSYVTTNETLATTELDTDEPILAARFLPKEDALVALGQSFAMRWELNARHPEANWSSLFAPVWYEGYPDPEHAWQSEGATDEFESKLGFMPLVFGTLKATFYTMIFGVPLALLAAIFTSEFLDRRLRVPIKSTIEMMASLPSVVLGFLAGIVIAPFAQRIIPATLAVFATLPFALLLGAYLWQLLPQRLVIRWGGMPRLACIAIALPIGVAAALFAGPWLERLFFAGDMELWLDGQIGTSVGGWMLILFPASAALTIFVGGRLFGSWIRASAAHWSRARCAVADLVKFGGGTLLTIVIALSLSWALELMGFDPRGSYVDTYVQRNALIVGFVMGFAVIPIIYTLAEDALSSVPEHLRHASLGAGATPWQTAMRVIVPTAMSGLFSAVMIGFGRAIGETMIVLMATGNTPVMEMNLFNGFRTLSANIAVELPEAVQNSTHYRALFLAALVLFAMTFVLNTIAESVRIRFRKRAFQL